MENSELYVLLSRLIFGFFAVFLSILLWSRTRDTAWMMVILGIILSYSETVYSTLELFGLVSVQLPVLFDIPVVRILFVNSPLIMFSCAFIVMMRRRKPENLF